LFESMQSELVALAQVIFIDLVLAGDNAIVVGLAAAGVEPSRRRMVITIGIAAAVVLRIFFALITTQLLAIIGLTLAGGILLLWVCWKLWRELRVPQHSDSSALEDGAAAAPTKTMGQAVWQITLADVSMSLDNVLAVAGAARDHVWVLVVGLALSVAFMGLAASLIARMIERHHWIAYAGLAVIAWVAVSMIMHGSAEVAEATDACVGPIEMLCEMDEPGPEAPKN
jgi:YjbE family integral membrane protein